MLDVRTTSRVMELADTEKMTQLEKGRTFDSYADFIKELNHTKKRHALSLLSVGPRR